MKLDDFLNGEFEDFDVERKQIDAIANNTISALEKLFDSSRGWPYEMSLGAPVGQHKWGSDLSTSTVAMISASLAAATDRGRRGALSKHIAWRPEEIRRKAAEDEGVLAIAHSGLELILDAATSAVTSAKPSALHSSTFGANDVFTLSWLFDLFAAVGTLTKGEIAAGSASSAAAEKLASVLDAVLIQRPELSQPSPTPLLEAKQLFQIIRADGSKEARGSEHAFPLLRLLQIKRWAQLHRGSGHLQAPLEKLGTMQETHWQMEFARRVHEQLSFHSIPDSRFDPAELAFALEGLAIAGPTSLDRAVVQRVFDVLAKEQERNPTLRPARPIKADPSGSALFPVSVEIFNSLLRTNTLVTSEFETSFVRPQLVSLCRRYFSWVRPRLVVGAEKHADVYGWHSEHINDPQLVHPWETSQVLLFLLGYRTIVDQHLAARGLHFAGLSARRAGPVRTPEETNTRWKKLSETRDPVALRNVGNGPDLAIYEAIGREFVSDHAQGKPARFSMILYGPPGTGKTNLAEVLALALGYPLITVTVSDFLAEGGLQIEARAKAVFSVLGAQKASVIIFDEIDHLLLDRNSKQYQSVDGSIQLMVPGMLTKIKDLRSAERSIFIIATNYEERIDGAIKRPGRIDRKYLVMPPDWGRRSKITKTILEEYSEKVRKIDSVQIGKIAESKKLLAHTARMSFPEIRAVIYDLVGSVDDVTKLLERFESYTYPGPVASLDGYQDRPKDTSKLLQEEYEALIAIEDEAETKFGGKFRAT